jgi:ribonucleotide reductase alpha subunit
MENTTETDDKKTSQQLCVIKRDGSSEEVSFDTILKRVKTLCQDMSPKLTSIHYAPLVMKVIDQLFHNIETTKIDELSAEQCASLCTKNPDYGELASRIVISNHQKNTLESFTDSMRILYENRDVHGNHSPLLDTRIWKIIKANKEELDNTIVHERDFLIDFFGFKTLERSYLLRSNNKIIERIQHMWLRVSIGIHWDDILSVKETYDLMSQKYFTHATPTLYNAGTPRPQLSSCYLISMEEDSIDGIYNTLKDCAKISKWAGGIGMHIHNVRANGSRIRSTNGTSNGIVPMLRVFNMTARYVDQGGGKRNGSFAIYIEPWHGDIESFLDLKLNHGDEELRTRDLFLALWIPSLFMKKVKDNGEWSLFCPDRCPGLSDCYGEEFDKLYESYCQRGMAIKTIKARDLWYKILDSQMETGTPYLLYKDAANEKSNQKNLGTIKSSNLCTEIIEYSDSSQTAVCNLASISLGKFVDVEKKTFNYDLLETVTRTVVANLDKVIDVNYYPTEKTRRSNFFHRPLGLGVQGLADAFALMDVPYHSDEAVKVNKLIFETMYYAALCQSNEISTRRGSALRELFCKYNASDIFLLKEDNPEYKMSREYSLPQSFTELEKGIIDKYKPIPAEWQNTNINTCGSYSSFSGSPASKGILQFDMWDGAKTSDRYDWDGLKTKIQNYGLRNSLLVAPMPTASTSQILGNNECFEPFTSNIYTRRTLAGEYVVINRHLVRELIDAGIWNDGIKDMIIKNKGSVQHIDCIPEKIKNKYKIVWEIPMRHMIDMARDRGAFVCQSQSLNLWMEDPNYKSLTSMHFYAWQQGLKTGIYYLRRKPKHHPQQFTLDVVSNNNNNNNNTDSIDEPCETCSS